MLVAFVVGAKEKHGRVQGWMAASRQQVIRWQQDNVQIMTERIEERLKEIRK